MNMLAQFCGTRHDFARWPCVKSLQGSAWLRDKRAAPRWVALDQRYQLSGRGHSRSAAFPLLWRETRFASADELSHQARRGLLTQRRTERQRPAPLGTFGNVSVPGPRAGAIVSLGLAVIAWLAIPVARPFILGTVGLGFTVGLILWRKHNR
jgi:hypothetical protein